MKKLLSSAALALLLAACGGGDDGPAPMADPTVAVPSSANDSSAGLIGYLKSLIAADATGKEPVSIDNLTPPAPENAEPEPV